MFHVKTCNIPGGEDSKDREGVQLEYECEGFAPWLAPQPHIAGDLIEHRGDNVVCQPNMWLDAFDTGSPELCANTIRSKPTECNQRFFNWAGGVKDKYTLDIAIFKEGSECAPQFWLNIEDIFDAESPETCANAIRNRPDECNQYLFNWAGGIHGDGNCGCITNKDRGYQCTDLASKSNVKVMRLNTEPVPICGMIENGVLRSGGEIRNDAGNRMVLQTDGSLVVSSSNGTVLFASGTGASPGCGVDGPRGSGAQQCDADGLWYDCSCSECNLQRPCGSNAGLGGCACPFFMYKLIFQDNTLLGYATTSKWDGVKVMRVRMNNNPVWSAEDLAPSDLSAVLQFIDAGAFVAHQGETIAGTGRQFCRQKDGARRHQSKMGYHTLLCLIIPSSLSV